MPHFVYILRCADGTLYTGTAADIARRMREHNASPRGARYTRGRRPVTLVRAEKFGTLGAARRREREIKGLSRERKLNLVKANSVRNVQS